MLPFDFAVNLQVFVAVISPFTTIVDPRHASVRAVGALGRMPGAVHLPARRESSTPSTGMYRALRSAIPYSTWFLHIPLKYRFGPMDHLRFTLGGWDKRRLPQNGKALPTSKPAQRDRLSGMIPDGVLIRQ